MSSSRRRVAAVAVVLQMALCSTAGAAPATRPSRPLRAPRAARRPSTSVPPSLSSDDARVRLVAGARAQIGVTNGYDPSYVPLAYPGGDVERTTGVCSDVIGRALRVLGIDLQVRIHEDMRANFAQYPRRPGRTTPDSNIDHRRVSNIATYFTRRGYSLPVTDDADDYLPGDIIAMKIPLDHIGIVTDRRVDGRPLVVHNVGEGAKEEDVLFAWTIVGHYRPV